MKSASHIYLKYFLQDLYHLLQTHSKASHVPAHKLFVQPEAVPNVNVHVKAEVVEVLKMSVPSERTTELSTETTKMQFHKTEQK